MMRTKSIWLGGFLCIASMVLSNEVMAQKSQQTLRIPIDIGVSAVDYYYDASPTENTWGPSFYDSLIDFDAVAGKFVPRLAQSWRHIDSKTIEFELRRDVKFHDGEAMNADDVAYILNWLVDPKVNLRLKDNWTHIKQVEKTGSHTVRVHLTQPTPYDLMRFAFRTYIYAEHLHSQLEKKETYGQTAVGTGPLQALKIDKNSGIVAERSRNYAHAGYTKPEAKAARIVAHPIPDMGTRVAQLVANGVDVVQSIDYDQAKLLANDPKFKMTVQQGLNYHYLAIPQASRKSIAPLGDLRVRNAIAKAINRESLSTIVYGNAPLPLKFEAVCWKVQLGCDYSKTSPDFDPAGAKKLLTEAGYGAGFDLEMVTYAIGSFKQSAEAAANMLHQVGIGTTVRPVPLTVARNLERDGKMPIAYLGFGGGGIYDSSGTMIRFFVREEFGDAELSALASETLGTVDPERRKEITSKVINMAIERGYVFPMIADPEIIAHSADVVIDPPVLRPNGPIATDYGWK